VGVSFKSRLKERPQPAPRPKSLKFCTVQGRKECRGNGDNLPGLSWEEFQGHSAAIQSDAGLNGIWKRPPRCNCI